MERDKIRRKIVSDQAMLGVINYNKNGTLLSSQTKNRGCKPRGIASIKHSKKTLIKVSFNF